MSLHDQSLTGSTPEWPVLLAPRAERVAARSFASGLPSNPVLDVRTKLGFAPMAGPDDGPSVRSLVPREAIDLMQSVRRGVERVSGAVGRETSGRARCLVGGSLGGSFCDADGLPRLESIRLDSLPVSGAFQLAIDVEMLDGGAAVCLAPRKLRVESAALPPRLRGGRFDVAVTAMVQAFWIDAHGATRYKPVAHGKFLWREVSAGVALGARTEVEGWRGLGSPGRPLPRELRHEGRRSNGATLVIVRLDVCDDFSLRAAMIGRMFGFGGAFSQAVRGGDRR